jgi:hypothetical protein
LRERAKGHEGDWVYSSSTPFLTRLPTKALIEIVRRKDGVANAIIEKYCIWVRETRFLFHFADTVCGRLTAIFDNGDAAFKALAICALIDLGESHNRWYVMRCMLQRCSAASLTRDISRRLAIEIKIEKLENQFRRCVEEVSWDVALLSQDLRALCE